MVVVNHRGAIKEIIITQVVAEVEEAGFSSNKAIVGEDRGTRSLGAEVEVEHSRPIHL